MRSQIIESQAHLTAVCETLNKGGLITLDTEFLRVRTYYPKLCLLQVADAQDVFCIDPLSVDLNIEPLQRVLLSRNTIKVFHAARQDIEVLYAACGVVPRAVFDTQIAAAMLGLGDQIGYANLVDIITGNNLAKAHTRTDWCQRPLTPQQIEYAIDDVRYLATIYDYFQAELKKCGRLQWVFEECATLTDPTLYEADPEAAYKKIGHGQKLEPMAQGILKELATWRERASQTLDLPRNWVAKDAVLISISRMQPATPSELSGLEGISAGFVKRHGSEVLSLIKNVTNKDHHPVIWSSAQPLDPEQRALRKRITKYLQKVAADARISLSLLGNRQEVESLVRGKRDVNLLKGWRAQLIGDGLASIFA